ncbi:hypothetical protein FKM82_006912 [Ascaphus truei]
MVICSFFAQGRCRFGDKCWNEHPRDGGGGRHQYQYHAHQRYQQQHQQQPPANYGGGRGSWVPPPKYVQPSSFSKSTTWSNRDSGRAAFGSFPGSGTEDDRGRNLKSTGASAFNTSQNRFSALGSHEHTGDAQTDEEGNVFDIIMADMEIWESSGQWLFSVYSVLKEKRNISGNPNTTTVLVLFLCCENWFPIPTLLDLLGAIEKGKKSHVAKSMCNNFVMQSVLWC